MRQTPSGPAPVPAPSLAPSKAAPGHDPSRAAADLLTDLEPLLPRGWGASLELEDPLTRMLEPVAACGDRVAERAPLVAVAPLPEAFTTPPEPDLLARLGCVRARVVTLTGERPFGRLLLLAATGAAPLDPRREEEIRERVRGAVHSLERLRSRREDEKFGARLRRVAEGELAATFTRAAVALIPGLTAAAVLHRDGDHLEVLRAWSGDRGALQRYLRRTVTWEGSHLRALTEPPDRHEVPPESELPADEAPFSEWRLFRSLTEATGARRLETVPLEAGGGAVGSFLLFHGEEVGSAEERTVVDRLARSLSLALGRVRPESRQASTLLYLQELLRAPGQALTPVLETVVEEMIRSLGADAGALALLDAKTGRLLLSEAAGYGDTAVPPAIPLEERSDRPASILAHVARSGEPYVAGDTRHSPIYLPSDPKIRSEMAVPLRLHGETFGVAIVSSRSPGFFGGEEVPRFQLFADQVAIAVDNARLMEALEARVERESARRQRRAHGFDPKAQAAGVEYHFGNLVGDPDGPMGEVYEAIERLAPLDDETVLIFGETGTGKEMVAHALHNASGRVGRSMIATNFASLGGDPNLIQSELFGHERGSFTGASARRRGCFEGAHRSTLLIDEIGDVVPSVQVKLLRVLGRSSEREIVRLGGEEPIRADVRVIAATHRDLPEEIRAGRFREDLYYRLSALVIRLPALRERPADVALLARHFLGRRARATGGAPVLDPAAERMLAEYAWPGNIRQLESVLVRSLLLFGSPTEVTADDVRRALEVEEGGAVRGLSATGEPAIEPPPADHPELAGWFWRAVWEPWKAHRIPKDALRALIDRTLAETGGYYTRTAERLGVERSEYRKFVDFLANAGCKVDHRRHRS